ncbi:PQQ-binding-like beta-propeller repeat protein, partial [candidate division KSB1 bacterium]|nr:PQQ-binding-like beta-propeller repeat protein [candidate division KSB1 bacterium]
HGPPEQIIDGRLIIEGLDCIQARDVYTGRVLWQTALQNAGTYGVYYNETYANTPLDPSYNQEHIPGANSRGSNFVATSDWIYVIDDNECRALDITNGETVKIISLPRDEASEKPDWGYLGVLNDLLIAGSDFVPFSQNVPLTEQEAQQVKEMKASHWRKFRDFNNFDNTASQKLVIMDRHSGEVKWQLEARYGFIHNAIAASQNSIYCLDKYPPAVENRQARRGIGKPSDYRLLALEAESGRMLWQANDNIFGSWLSVSPDHHLLLQATRPSRDMVRDEVGERMIVYNSADGRLIWDRKIEYENPPILHGARIITDRAAYDLFTGEQIHRTDPLTGEKIPWTYTRTYGCNYNIAGEHLLSFRSAAAGFYDLFTEGGTGNYGGFKSGCTSNLIAADGVLNAPDYTRTCQCSYQNQTSLALIHMPELEYWTTNDWKWSGKPIQRVGINLNAPGDRIAKDGTLWLDYPSVGGESPDLPIEIDTTRIKPFRRHSSKLTGDGDEWIAASGFAGAIEMEIVLALEPSEEAEYTVDLYFAEVFAKKLSERVFDVFVQGHKVLENLDIVREAGAANKTLVKTIADVKATDKITIACRPSVGTAASEPILSGIKIVKMDINERGGI